MRGFLTLADAGNAVLVGLLAREVGARSTGGGALVYALSPVAILVVGYHGQFDNLAALPLLAAALLTLRARGAPRLAPVWALATLALCIKHLCLFSVWMLLVYAAGGVKKAAVLMAGSLAVFGTQFLPWLEGSAGGIVRNVLRYSGVPRPYGLTTILPRGVAAVLFVAVLAVLPVFARGPLRLGLTRAMEALGHRPHDLHSWNGRGVLHRAGDLGGGSRLRRLLDLLRGRVSLSPDGPEQSSGDPDPAPWNAVWLSLVLWGVLLIRGARLARAKGVGE